MVAHAWAQGMCCQSMRMPPKHAVHTCTYYEGLVLRDILAAALSAPLSLAVHLPMALLCIYEYVALVSGIKAWLQLQDQQPSC